MSQHGVLQIHESTTNGVRRVIYRAYHPETHVSGWAGFVERDVCVFIGWHKSRFAAARAVRRAAKRF